MCVTLYDDYEWMYLAFSFKDGLPANVSSRSCEVSTLITVTGLHIRRMSDSWLCFLLALNRELLNVFSRVFVRIYEIATIAVGPDVS